MKKKSKPTNRTKSAGRRATEESTARNPSTDAKAPAAGQNQPKMTSKQLREKTSCDEYDPHCFPDLSSLHPRIKAALLSTLPDAADMPEGDSIARIRAGALKSFIASHMQPRMTNAKMRAQAWKNRVKLTDYEDSAEARKEQAMADILDEIFEYNRQLKAAEEEGKNGEYDPNDDLEPTMEEFRSLWRSRND